MRRVSGVSCRGNGTLYLLASLFALSHVSCTGSDSSDAFGIDREDGSSNNEEGGGTSSSVMTGMPGSSGGNTGQPAPTAGGCPSQVKIWPEPNMAYPNNLAGIVNVTRPPYNAVPNDGKDDTAAIQRAIEENRTLLVYLPNGTYDVSGTLFATANGAKRYFVQGQSTFGTIIRLRDGASGFGDPSNPRSVLQMSTVRTDATAFRNQVSDLTIDTGKNNPGAMGLAFRASNWGMVQRVHIRSSDDNKRGVAGLSLDSPLNGPFTVKHLVVDGFDYGVSYGSALHGASLYHVYVLNQRVAGIRDAQQVMTVRDFRSTNTVPAFKIDGGVGNGRRALVGIVNADLCGGASSAPAIANDGNGALYVRDIRTTGYGQAVGGSAPAEDGRPSPSGTSLGEWVSHDPVALFGNGSRTSRLGYAKTPDVGYGDPSAWAVVNASGNDDTAAIQSAIDSGAQTVLLWRDRGRPQYRVSRTIVVRGAVRRILGTGDAIVSAIGGLSGSNDGVFRFDDGAGAVALENFEIRNAWAFVQNTAREVVLTSVSFRGYRNMVNNSRVYMENATASNVEFSRGQLAFAQMLNPEVGAGNSNFNIVNSGAKVWVLGFKTERDQTVFETRDGGATEVIGAFNYLNRGSANAPGYVVTGDNSSLVLSAKQYSGTYRPVIRETRNGQTRNLDTGPLLPARNSSILPLFVTP